MLIQSSLVWYHVQEFVCLSHNVIRSQCYTLNITPLLTQASAKKMVSFSLKKVINNPFHVTQQWNMVEIINNINYIAVRMRSIMQGIPITFSYMHTDPSF